MESFSIRVRPPTVPTAGATVTLLDTADLYKGLDLQTLGIKRVHLAFPGLSQPSATDGLIGYESGDKGVTWSTSTFASVEEIAADPTAGLPITVAADTGADHDEFDFDVAGRSNVKFTFTASGTAPSAASWANVTIVLSSERHAAY
jgi:hypothetical protein